MYPNIRVFLIIGCTHPVSSAEAERSFSGLRRIKSYLRNRMSDERLSGLALMHLHHDLDIDIDEICTIFVTKHRRRMIQGCISGQGIITYNHDRWEGVWGRSNLPQKSPAVLSEPKFGLPQSKIPGSAPALL